ncbi:MAG: right-handed parallel beta-helix repeat-containing protein [Polyangiales bacterium]
MRTCAFAIALAVSVSACTGAVGSGHGTTGIGPDDTDTDGTHGPFRTPAPDSGVDLGTPTADGSIDLSSGEGDGGDAATTDPAADGGTGPTTTDWPDATNTGVGSVGALEPSGSIVVSANDTVIENRDIGGSVTVRANRVTLRNCRIRSAGLAVLLDTGFGDLLMEDVTIEGTNVPTREVVAVTLRGMSTIRRLNISKYGTGIRYDFGSTGLIEDSYFHDMHSIDGQAKDGGIHGFGTTNLVIRHNRMELDGEYGKMVLKFPCDTPASWTSGKNITIEDNIIAGGAYAIAAGYCTSTPSKIWENVVIKNNRFSTKFHPKCGEYGVFLPDSVNAALVTGNVWHETGLPY